MGDETLNSIPQIAAGHRQWFETWKDCLQNVLAQVSGKPITDCRVSTVAPPLAASDLWYAVTASGALRGEMALRIPVSAGVPLSRMLLGELPEGVAAAGESPLSNEQKEALEELLRQITGLAATATGATAGGALQLQLAASSKPSWKPYAIACLQSGTAIAVEVQISPALAAALHPGTQPSPTAGDSTCPADLAPPTSASHAEVPAVNYRRLMGVGLDVKLRFGIRRMPLRDVLALSAGAVVELENALNSPVDLLLDGRLIAQGEVVIVDGKYGLRVTEVINPHAAGG